MTPEIDFDLGELRITISAAGKPPEIIDLGVDRLAVDRHGLLYLLSVAGPMGAVKSLRATLNAKVSADYSLAKVHCTNGAGGSGFASRLHSEENRKYDVFHHTLGYGQIHALFLAKVPGFLKKTSDDCLFAALKQPCYTTPILRSWVPALATDLKTKGLLTPLFGFRCRCSSITATTEDLDAIVTQGIQDGRLRFRELNLVGTT